MFNLEKKDVVIIHDYDLIFDEKTEEIKLIIDRESKNNKRIDPLLRMIKLAKRIDNVSILNNQFILKKGSDVFSFQNIPAEVIPFLTDYKIFICYEKNKKLYQNNIGLIESY